MSTQLSDAELQAIEATTPAPSGKPSERFLGTCVEWAEEWILANTIALTNAKILPAQSVIFLFSETPDLERGMLTGLGTLNERVYRVTVAQDTQGVIVCNENFQQMVRIGPALASVDAALEFASTKLSADRTFVIINFAQRRLYVHRKGDDLATWIDTLVPMELSFQDAPLSADRIEKDVQDFHHNYLAKPANLVAQTMWKGKSEPYKLHPGPEKRIQAMLLVTLKASYRKLQVWVDEEPHTRDGICDLRVAWPVFNGALPTASTMFELKVLYDEQGPGKHYGWVLSGIEQAEGYRRPDSEAVYACIFDGRSVATEQFLDLDGVAKDKDVRLRRYRMDPPRPSPSNAAKPVAKKAAASSGVKGTRGGRKKASTRKSSGK